MILGISNIFGLPAHPFLVHVPIVLIPLALVAAVLALHSKFRRELLVVTAVLAVIGAVFLVLGAGSGESLKHDLPRSEAIHEHAEIGEQSQGPTVAFAVVAVCAVLAREVVRRNRLWRGKALPKWSVTALLSLTIVAGVVATVVVSQAGHSGAKSVWESRLSQKNP